MRRRIRHILLSGLTVLLLAAAAAGAGETAGGQVTGYFTDYTYVRPVMEKTTANVASFPPYTIVTLDVVDGTWALYTAPDGTSGYVDYTRLLPVPVWEEDPERQVYSDKKIGVRSLPVYEAAVVYTAEPFELLTVNGHIKGFDHVAAADGTEGYIISSWAQDAVFTPKAISPTTFFVSEETALLTLPLRGAKEAGTLSPDEFYQTEGTCGDYYAVVTDGETRYVPKAAAVLCPYRGGDGRTFFRRPSGVKKSESVPIETLFIRARVLREDAELRRPGKSSLKLKRGSSVNVYSVCGRWAGVTCGNQGGYLLRQDMEILTGAAMQSYLRGLDLSGGRIERSGLLDEAFAMVEDGNPFQARYNLLTGADVKSIFPLGIPYFWGGRNYRGVTERLPKYTTREAWQSSGNYYQQGTIYVYGFDCVGFVKNVYSRAGRPISGNIVDLRANVYCSAGKHVYCDNVHPLPEDWTEAARVMRVGDIMQIHHPGNHVMIYMGTLRDYGYTEQQLPALAKYLDHPLMIQCGENPYSYLRFKNLIESTSDSRISRAEPTDGGVGVCILGVDPADAEMVLTYHDSTRRCFDVEGSCVTILNFGSVTDYFVYRMDGVPAAPEETETPEPAGSPEPTDTVSPDPAGSAEPTDSVSPKPAGSAEPTGSVSPKPTDIPKPTETVSPRPTGIPEPKETDSPIPAETAAAAP